MMRIIFTMILAVSAAHATPSNTDRFIHALAESLADRVIGDDELVLLIDGAERSEVVNPICEATAELRSDRWLAYQVFKSYVDDQDLDVSTIKAWARNNLVEQACGRKTREQSREKSVLPWKVPDPTLISAGGAHTCAVKADGMVECWGENTSNQCDGHKDLKLGPVRSVSAGFWHSCAVKADDMVECWGDNHSGQSDGHKTLNIGPVQSVSTGESHTCAVKTDGMVACWGDNEHGQVNGHKTLDLGPVQSLSTGDTHTCALKGDGTIACWGDDFYGQVNGHKALTLGTVTSVSSGRAHSCAVRTDGTVACWGGYIAMGPLFDKPKKEHFVPIVSLSSGTDYTYALNANGQLQCWGCSQDLESDIRRVQLEFVQHVSAGRFHACAAKLDSTVTCWGLNTDGQLNVPKGLVVMSKKT